MFVPFVQVFVKDKKKESCYMLHKHLRIQYINS